MLHHEKIVSSYPPGNFILHHDHKGAILLVKGSTDFNHKNATQFSHTEYPLPLLPHVTLQYYIKVMSNLCRKKWKKRCKSQYKKSQSKHGTVTISKVSKEAIFQCMKGSQKSNCCFGNTNQLGSITSSNVPCTCRYALLLLGHSMSQNGTILLVNCTYTWLH